MLTPPPRSTLFPYTTLFRSVDALLRQTHVHRKIDDMGERIMDSMDQERERGITIRAKNASVIYNGVKINIVDRSEEHTSELQSRRDLVCRLLLEKKKNESKH